MNMRCLLVAIVLLASMTRVSHAADPDLRIAFNCTMHMPNGQTACQKISLELISGHPAPWHLDALPKATFYTKATLNPEAHEIELSQLVDGGGLVAKSKTSWRITRNSPPVVMAWQATGGGHLEVRLVSLKVGMMAPPEPPAAPTAKCRSCYGSGVCRACNGKKKTVCGSCWGKKACMHCRGGGCYVCRNSGDCNSCKGSGKFVCSACRGSGACYHCGGKGVFRPEGRRHAGRTEDRPGAAAIDRCGDLTPAQSVVITGGRRPGLFHRGGSRCLI